jgi:hypothetical protein
MVAKLTRLIHRIAIQLHLVAESCTICSSHSRQPASQPAQKLLDTPLYCRIYTDKKQKTTSVMKKEKLKNLPLLQTDWHIGYFDKGGRMANGYSISLRTWRWTKKLFFHFLDLIILNSFINLSSCSSTTNHRKFNLVLVQHLLEMSIREPHLQFTPRGRPNLQVSQTM